MGARRARSGPDGAEVIARQDRVHGAGWAEAYRELGGHDASGTRRCSGPRTRPWRSSRPATSNGRAAWGRKRNWAPRRVDDELAATHEHRRAGGRGRSHRRSSDLGDRQGLTRLAQEQ